jgi:hypothetical protein
MAQAKVLWPAWRDAPPAEKPQSAQEGTAAPGLLTL